MEVAELVAYLPERVELVGGPYCGSVLFPQHEIITDVFVIETHSELDPRFLPHNFEPQSPTEIIFEGALGLCLYIMESEGKWSFKGEVEVQFAG